MRPLIALDDGHGAETPGKRTPPLKALNGVSVRENTFNSTVVALLKTALQRCGLDVLCVAPTEQDVSLKQRVATANRAGATLYLSIHYDAYDGQFDAYDPEGHTVYICPGSKEGRRLGESVLKYLSKGTPQKNRGIKEAPFYVLKYTDMPAILTENGFMDNEREALLMVDPTFQKEVAEEHAQGICTYLGIPYVKEDVVSKWAEAAQAFVIEKGVSDGTRPRDAVTREEVWEMLKRYDKSLR
ncbi:N-acetylmuramoyl-L-alanine amidase family protein [Fusibacter sp. JL298sf-3]